MSVRWSVDRPRATFRRCRTQRSQKHLAVHTAELSLTDLLYLLGERRCRRLGASTNSGSRSASDFRPRISLRFPNALAHARASSQAGFSGALWQAALRLAYVRRRISSFALAMQDG